jgi:hypothetical protein
LIIDFLKGHHEQMKNFKEEYSTAKPLCKGNVKPINTFPATPTSHPPILRSTKAENPKETTTHPVNTNANIPNAKDESFSRNQVVNTVCSSASQHKSLGDFARKNIDEDVVNIILK